MAGGFRLALSEQERALLGVLATRLRVALDAGDASTRRLHPPAYPDDAEAEEAYRAMTRDDLDASRAARLRTFERTLAAERLDPHEAEAWLGTLNDARLVLGTALEVTEDDEPLRWDLDDEDALERLAFLYAGFLEEQLVAELASSM